MEIKCKISSIEEVFLKNCYFKEHFNTLTGLKVNLRSQEQSINHKFKECSQVFFLSWETCNNIIENMMKNLECSSVFKNK